MKIVILTLALACMFTYGYTQTTPQPSGLTRKSSDSFFIYQQNNHPQTVVLQKGSDSLFVLPPLDTLITWAMISSPILKGQDAEIKKSTDDAGRVKKLWLDAVKLSGNLQRGSYGNTVVDQATLGYQTGTTISFSLYQMFSYKNNVKVYKDQITIDTYKREQLVLEIKLAIMNLYNNINSQKNIIRIRSEAYTVSYTQMQMAEKEFKKGSIEVGELSRVSEIYTKAYTDLESANNDLHNQFAQLEILTGKKLYTK